MQLIKERKKQGVFGEKRITDPLCVRALPDFYACKMLGGKSGMPITKKAKTAILDFTVFCGLR
jgi:hypothetical protein